MTTVLSINPFKNGFQFAAVTGNSNSPILIDRKKCINPEPEDIAYASNWMNSVISRALDDHKAKVLAIKLNTNISTKVGVISHGMPVGICALLAHQKQLTFETFTSQILKSPKRFGLQSGASTHDWIDQLKDGNPYWNNDARNAVLGGALSLNV